MPANLTVALEALQRAAHGIARHAELGDQLVLGREALGVTTCGDTSAQLLRKPKTY
jgi:hypothetical protein